MTDPDPNILKSVSARLRRDRSAAAYLVELARSSAGGRYRKSAKIDALRECKEEILEAHRSGISIHRIAQIFRERNVDISTQHLMRAIWLFIAEGEGAKAKASVAPAPGTFEKPQTPPVTYQVPEPASALVREEEFAKQLRLARYLAGTSLGPPRATEKVADRARSVTKPKPRAKAQPRNQKGAEVELARERRRVHQSGRHKASSSGPGRSEKQRHGPGR